jgi:hypothetical protein
VVLEHGRIGAHVARVQPEVLVADAGIVRAVERILADRVSRVAAGTQHKI